MNIQDVSFLVPTSRNVTEKKRKANTRLRQGSKKRRKGKSVDEVDGTDSSIVDIDDKTGERISIESEAETQQQWIKCETLDDAITAGWKPGQTFSFVATNVRGQRMLNSGDTAGARPLGVR
jgi:hypothetical protein